MLHVYNHTVTFTKLATYPASVVKPNFGNFGYTPLGYAPGIVI